MKPRVLFLNDKGSLGGAQLSLLDIARYYSESSQVTLFSDGLFREQLERVGVAVEVLPAPHTIMGIPREGTIVQDLRAVPGVLKLTWQVAQVAREFDLLYANSSKALVIGALAGKVAKKSVIWHARDMRAVGTVAGIHRRLEIVLANNMTARVIANSKATATAFVESGGHNDTVYMVYNGVDPTPFDSVKSTEVDALRRVLRLAEAPVLGVFSRLAPWKGQHVLLDALAHLPNVHVLLVGGAAIPEEHAYAKALHEQVRTLNIAERVHFLGVREDIPQLMRLSDVVVHTPVMPEPFGRVIVEGMLARRPVVASADGGALEIIQDKVNGILVPPGDEKALAAALSDLLKSPHRAHVLAEAGYSAASRFSLQSMLDGVAQNIEEVVSQRANTL